MGPLGIGGRVGIFHENNPDWEGPTGYYRSDFRAPLAQDVAMTYSPIGLWAEPGFANDTMFLSVKADTLFPPPTDREYSLELLYVPEEIEDAPAVGTVWTLPTDGSIFEIEMPTFRSDTGEGTYQFAFTASAAVPEPASGLVMLLRRRCVSCPQTIGPPTGRRAHRYPIACYSRSLVLCAKHPRLRRSTGRSCAASSVEGQS